MAGAGSGGRGHIPMYFGVGLELMRHAIAASSERTYQGHFGAWVEFRVRCGLPVFLERCRDGMANVWHVFEYVAYAFSTKKLRSATIESHLSAIKFFHRISRGFEIDTTHPVIANALKGTARLHADVGNQATVRRPVSWDMLLAGENLIPTWRAGGRVLWLALCASFCLLTRASEMVAEKPGYEFTRLIVCSALMLPSFAEIFSLLLRSGRPRIVLRFGFAGRRVTNCGKGRLSRVCERVRRCAWGKVAAPSMS